MTNKVDRLLIRLEKEGEKTFAFFSNLPDRIWATKLYADGQQWQVKQVFAHLVQSEQSILRLIKVIYKGGEGTPEDFDLDGYNERKVEEFSDHNIPQLLELYRSSRQATREWVAQLADEDLDRQGRHPFLGITRLEDIIKLMYRHNQIHQRDIKRLINAGV